MKSQIFKLSAGIGGAYHLILGVIALALPVDTVIQVITFAFGMTLEITPQLPLVLKFASVYLIAFGGTLLLLTSDPAKYRIFAYPALALFGIRFINRIIFFSTLAAAGVADSRNMMGAGIILVFFLLILCTLPKKQANS